MDQDKKMKLYLRGYEEGQKEAWSSIKYMISRYDGWELKSRIESKLGTLYQEVKSKKVDLREDPSPLLIEDEEDSELQEAENKSNLPLYKGESLLFFEERHEDSLNKFLELVTEGRNGLFISRDAPDKLMKKVKFPLQTSFIWLSKSSGKIFSHIEQDTLTISPTNLQKLSSQVGNFLKHSDEGVIYISGLPSMINYVGFNKTQEFLSWVLDRVSERDGLIICSIPEKSIKQKRLGVLKAEFDRIA